MSLGDLLDFDNISINNGSRHEQGQKKTDGQFADTPSPSTETIIQRSSGWEDLPPLNAEPFTWDEDEQDGLVQELANKSLSVMEAQTDWEVLGLGWGATEEAVNQSFRRLILQLHPDKNPGDPEAAAKTSRVSDCTFTIEYLVCKEMQCRPIGDTASRRNSIHGIVNHLEVTSPAALAHISSPRGRNLV